MVELFFYRPITAGRSLRILKVFGSSYHQHPLCCELIDVTLDDKLGYEAISYTWGGQEPTQVILCEGKQLLVTKNCDTALRHFRPAAEKEYRFLWIDSVCINQSNDSEATKERQVQVGMMGRIYSNASQVLVWLGDGSNLPHNSTMEIVNLPAVFEWLSRITKVKVGSTNENLEHDFLRVLDEVNVSQDLKDTFVLVPWFKRAWIVQEVALSKRAVLVYGQIQIYFDAILHTRNTLIEFSRTSFRAKEVLAVLDNGFDIHSRASNYLHNTSSNSATSVAEIMEEVRFSDSSRPEDKVFAMHGLLTATNFKLPNPDYSKPEGRIYQETALNIITSSRTLDVLDQVHGLGHTIGLVSWAPDWAKFKHAIKPALRKSRYNIVSKFSEPKFRFENNGMHLSLSGVIPDRISSRAENAIMHDHEGLGPPQDYTLWTQNVQPSEPLWRKLLENNPQHSMIILQLWNIHVLRKLISFTYQGSRTNGDVQAVLYATLLSRDWNLPSVDDEKADLEAWEATIMGDVGPAQALREKDSSTVKWMSEIIQYIRKTPQLTVLLETLEFSIFEAISHSSTLRSQHDRILACSAYQTIFRTNTGMLGMAPHTIRIDDEIVVFSGGRFPMVSRRQGEGNHFQLITPAYVHGMMSGEVWPEDESTLQDLNFV